MGNNQELFYKGSYYSPGSHSITAISELMDKRHHVPTFLHTRSTAVTMQVAD